jgi:hypothetical protein
MVMARDVENRRGGSEGTISDCLAILTARRTAPHCLSEPFLSKCIMRRSVGICPIAWRSCVIRHTSSFSNCSRLRVRSFWPRRYRDLLRDRGLDTAEVAERRWRILKTCSGHSLPQDHKSTLFAVL